MSSSESESEDSYTTDDSEFDFISDIRVEFEEPNAILEEQSTQVVNNVNEVAPYSDEPLASDEWIRNYEEKKEQEQIRRQDLQNRLDKVTTSDWCTCGNCDVTLSQNVYEAECCMEIEGCVQALSSHEVLEDTVTAPSCVTLHPGFRVVCLEKWSLRLAASKYRTKDRQKYRQNAVEETFLRSVAYREFCRLVYGCLGKIRKPLPSCAYHAIRAKFNAEGEQMTGFEEDD